MILYQKDNPDVWFSWDTKTMKHYYPKMDYDIYYKVLGPTKWNLEHNLKINTIILGPDVLGGWDD